MKKNIVIVLVLSCFLTACLGGPAGPQTPRHLTLGERQAVEGMEWYARGCFQRSLEHFLRAYEFFAAADQIAPAARALNNMANAYRKIGDLDTAFALYSEAAVCFQDQGDNAGHALALTNHAAALLDADQPGKARSLLDRAQALLAPEDTGVQASILLTRAVLASREGKPDEALGFYAQVLPLLSPDDKAGRAALFYGRGKALLAQEQPQQAIDALARARDLDAELGNTRAMAQDLACLARAEREVGNADAALDLYKRAALAYALAESPEQAQEALAEAAELARKTGRPDAIPKLFVEKFLAGKAYEYPCRR